MEYIEKQESFCQKIYDKGNNTTKSNFLDRIK